ncbi:hypothetical protein SDC9_201118 [bioreactor metagenome]|uniref:Uncharacterized protein n=1 Tax=bioreactor metagenome TaxID=1076179 RepID=A0A645IYX0_9ZZZZ
MASVSAEIQVTRIEGFFKFEISPLIMTPSLSLHDMTEHKRIKQTTILQNLTIYKPLFQHPFSDYFALSFIT